jgi:hypothetical protein
MAAKVKKERFAAGHEERFRVLESQVQFLGDEKKDGKRRFKAVAYTGKDVGRFWGRMIINSSGLKRDEKMGMLLEHDDRSPVAVCESHDVDKKTGLVTLEGYFLSDKASEDAAKVIARADEGWPWKMSVGVRFLKHHDLEEGAEETVNGRKCAGPMTIIDEAQLFETSFIHVSPADWDTEAAVMRAKAQERSMGDENQATTPAAPTPILKLSAISADERKELKSELKAEQKKAREAMRAAIPGNGATVKAFRSRALRAGLSPLEAKAQWADELTKQLKDKKDKLRAIKSIQSDKIGEGVSFSELEVVHADPKGAIMKLEDRVALALEDDSIGGLWDEHSRKALLGALKPRFRVPELLNGQKNLRHLDKAIEVMARDLYNVAKERKDTRFMSPTAREMVGVYLALERLGVGKSGPDLARVVVKGFIGSFYQSYEEEYTSAWAQKLTFQVPSDQEAELVRWLAAPPQLQEWKGPRIAKDLPIYSQILQNLLYEATLDVDKFDWKNQKFGLITKSFGEMGAVASQHWDLIVSLNLIEANPVGYDSKNFFSTTHTLGGDSGTMVNDLTVAGGFGSLQVADPANPTQLEAAKILLQCVPQLRTFKWANGLPINGTARKFLVMVPSVNPAFEGAFLAATRNERLDLGATNPLFATGHNFEVVPNPYLTSSQYVYIFRLDTSRSPFLRAEPGPIEMQWMGEGTTYAFENHKYAMGLESTRGIAPGAWESALRLKIGA